MSDECNLCGGSGVVSVGQQCICRYGPSELAPVSLLASSRVLTEIADIRNTNFNFCSPESVKDMICKRIEAAEILDLKEIASNAALLANVRMSEGADK